MLQSPAPIKIIKPSEKDSFFVFDSPHSGTTYPADFAFDCPRTDLTRTADHYIDELFDFAPTLGASFLCAEFPRCYVDVNRAVNDLDPLLIDDIPPAYINNPPDDMRSDVGYGVIRRLVQRGHRIYDNKISWTEAEARIKNYYEPYHQALADLVRDAHAHHGKVIHINCHAMPSRVAMTTSAGFGLWARSVDICLGTLNGASADNDIVKSLEIILKSKGYRVSLNDPYKGAEIIRRTGNPAQNIHSIQIELNKALYMNEKTFEKSNNFNILKDNLKATFEEFEAELTRQKSD
jgi:N-formylglutamate deformylase